jgi:HSP20 family molecular chaperone IbpA
MKYLEPDSNFWGWPDNSWHDWVGYPKHKWFLEGESRILKVELPGIKKEDINLYIRENSYLCIEADNVNYSWWVDDVDIEKIKADYRDGLLVINLPKRVSDIKKITIE